MFFSFPPLFWALIGAGGFAAWNLVSRRIMRDEKDDLALAAINENLSALALLGVLLLVSLGEAADGSATAQTLGATVQMEAYVAFGLAIALYTISGLLSYRVFRAIEASERAVVNQVQIAWVVVGGILLLSEPLRARTLLAAGLVIIGAVLCTYRPGKHRWGAAGVQLAVLVSLIYGSATLADKIAIPHFSTWVYILPMYLMPGLAAIGLMVHEERMWMGSGRAGGASRRERGAKPGEATDANGRRMRTWIATLSPIRARVGAAARRHGANLLLLSALSVLPYLAYLFALRGLPASVVSPLICLNVILTALGGMLFLGEREGWAQKAAGALLALAGAWMLAS